MTQKQKPKGAPASAGGQFDQNDQRDRASSSLSGWYVNHDSLMDIGETRTLITSDIEFGKVTVTTDEDSGRENVSVVTPKDRWGHSYNYDSDEDRVAFLAQYDGIEASATRVEPGDDGREHYSYEVALTHPESGETITAEWGTGTSEFHERTPRTADVLHSLITDASSARNTSDIKEWMDEFGYEPDYDEDDPYE